MNKMELTIIAFLRRLLPGVAGRAHPGVQARRRVHQRHHSRHRHRAAARHRRPGDRRRGRARPPHVPAHSSAGSLPRLLSHPPTSRPNYFNIRIVLDQIMLCYLFSRFLQKQNITSVAN
jgi:hypothetical protein